MKCFFEALKTDTGIIFVAADMDISQFKNKNIIKELNTSRLVARCPFCCGEKEIR
jgi:hypothetical protein